MKWIGRMAGCWRRASALASWRKRVSMPGVQAISGCSTLQARRRSRSWSHSSYTSANPPRPTSRLTWYLGPSARARRSAVGTAVGADAGCGGAATRSLVMTVGEGLPHAGQNAEPVGISARHAGHVICWVVTARKIRGRGAACNGEAPCTGAACRARTYSPGAHPPRRTRSRPHVRRPGRCGVAVPGATRSEEHTSELQSRSDLVCRLLLEKKKNQTQLHLRSRLRARYRA